MKRSGLCAGLVLAAVSLHGTGMGHATAAALRRAPAGSSVGILVRDGDDLAAAVAAAPVGSTVRVGPGQYDGPLVIDRTIRLEGRGRPVIRGDGRGDVVRITAPDVTLEGFVVRGSGDRLEKDHAGAAVEAPRATIEDNVFEDVLFGVYLKRAPQGVVRGNAIRGKPLASPRRGDGIRIWYSQGSRVENNDVRAVRDVVIWFSPDTLVRGNRVTEGRYGVHTMFSDRQVVEENVLAGNSVGAFLMYGRDVVFRGNLLHDNHGPSGYGIGLKDVDDVDARGNRFVGNRVGIYVDNSPREPEATVRFERNVVAYNEIGMELLPAVRRNTFVDNALIDNGEQVAIAGGGTLRGNDWSVAGRGNFWSDYAGFDADRDGIGDVPYVASSLYEDLMAMHPSLRLFRLGPASDALDLAAKAFPLFRPRQKMVDEHPLIAAPEMPAVPGLPSPNAARSAGASIALLGVAVLVLVFAGAGPPAVRAKGRLRR